jgi:hypothetical protein
MDMLTAACKHTMQPCSGGAIVETLVGRFVCFLLVCCGDAAVAAAVVVVSIQGTKLYGPVNHCQI